MNAPSASLHDYALESWVRRRIQTYVLPFCPFIHGTQTDHEHVGLRARSRNLDDQQHIKAESGNGFQRCRAQKFESEAIDKDLLCCMIWPLLCLLVLPRQMVHWSGSYHRFTTRSIIIKASPSSSFGFLRYTVASPWSGVHNRVERRTSSSSHSLCTQC